LQTSFQRAAHDGLRPGALETGDGGGRRWSFEAKKPYTSRLRVWSERCANSSQQQDEERELWMVQVVDGKCLMGREVQIVWCLSSDMTSDKRNGVHDVALIQVTFAKCF
jgi:hypothetical protein